MNQTKWVKRSQSLSLRLIRKKSRYWIVQRAVQKFLGFLIWCQTILAFTENKEWLAVFVAKQGTIEL